MGWVVLLFKLTLPQICAVLEFHQTIGSFELLIPLLHLLMGYSPCLVCTGIFSRCSPLVVFWQTPLVTVMSLAHASLVLAAVGVCPLVAQIPAPSRSTFLCHFLFFLPPWWLSSPSFFERRLSNSSYIIASVLILSGSLNHVLDFTGAVTWSASLVSPLLHLCAIFCITCISAAVISVSHV